MITIKVYMVSHIWIRNDFAILFSLSALSRERSGENDLYVEHFDEHLLFLINVAFVLS
jgi:hypothetical protein